MANVIGIDISPVRPEWPPCNVSFLTEDVEEPWETVPDTLDYIHLRHMALCIRDMPRLLAQAHRALKPGGWIELQEFLSITDSDDGSKPDEYKYDEYVRLLGEGLSKLGIDLHGPQKNEDLLKGAGFVKVENRAYKVPIGPWRNEKGGPLQQGHYPRLPRSVHYPPYPRPGMVGQGCQSPHRGCSEIVK